MWLNNDIIEPFLLVYIRIMKNKIILAGAITALSASAFIYATVNKGVDVAAIDKSVAPTNDFFSYANGNWIKNNPIPESEGRWSAFNIVAERNNLLLKTILEDAAKNNAALPNSNIYKIGIFYQTAMDTAKLEQQRFDMLNPLLSKIKNINNTGDLISTIAELHMMGISAAFGFDVSQDVKNSNENIAYLAQGGLGLPDKDYYLKADERSVLIRQGYQKHIQEIFKQIDGNVNPSDLALILDLETSLARSCMSRTERRNMEIQYNLVYMQEFSNQCTNIDWRRYFSKIGIEGELNRFVVMQPEYFNQLNMLFMGDLKAWKLYLKWRVLNTTAPYLHKDAVNANFNFYGKMLTGTKEQKPRWKKAIGYANGMIGELVAQEYVKVAFTPESKKRVNVMVDNLRESFRERINNLDWMSAATKVKALEKLNSFTRKLGYPDKWTDLSELEVSRESFVTNYFNSSKFWFKHNLDKLNKPVDKSEWEMLPQTVNAYYNPVNNEIVFPAAIMQPPFFDPKADDAVNYGAIGAVIGHEFSHGFDDQGSKYDAQGNLNDWWTETDRKLFDARTKILVNQFNGFEVLDSVFVNGELTLGENIADLAGLTVAYDAYQRSLQNKSRTNIDGFTPEQRFFIGFGQVWRGHARNEFLRQQVVTDPHSPARFRVIGTLSNMPQFYQAFGVKQGDKMWLADSTRAKIW
jgi:putative endopeptidase